MTAGFRWGITSAATAIESRTNSEEGQSIWDVFAAAPGRVADGTTQSHGPQHLRFWREDVDLLQGLGINAYRLSLPWSTLHAKESHAEVAFYDRLVDTLLTAGITPMITVTHYDMPLPVMAEGGWLVRDTAEIFAEYAGRMATMLADRVPDWVTMNSPLVHTAYGYGVGIEAPGLTLLGSALQAGIHQLVGHGLAVQALRAAGAARIGIANNHAAVRPASGSEADMVAAGLYNSLHNHAFADPLLLGSYPEALAEFGPVDLDTDDLAIIAAPLDFYGVNYYHPVYVEAVAENSAVPFSLVPGPVGADHRPLPFTGNDWPIDPTALTTTLFDLAARYPQLPPVVLTEIGYAGDGSIDDADRQAFLSDHLTAALAAGTHVDLQGFFYWSLLDGWEFGEGLTRTYGLVAVDPETGHRTPRAGYRHYRDLIADHRSI